MTQQKKALAKPQNKPATIKGLSSEQIQLLIRTVAKGASMDELGLFFNIAKRAGLDPFTRQIHLIPRNVKQSDGSYKTVRTTQVGIDGYLAIAERSSQLAGIDDAIYDDGKVYEKGEPINPSKAAVTVYRMVQGQRVSFTATARWKEYFPGDKLGYMWKKMPYGQLSKCALALALRKAFPNDLSGLYIHEEMEQAGPEASEPIQGEVEKPKVEEKKEEKYICQGCDIEITKTVADYSVRLYGNQLCRECQKGAEKIKK
jgi:phage recombination protein Bet